jgi:hypothetical protein
VIGIKPPTNISSEKPSTQAPLKNMTPPVKGEEKMIVDQFSVDSTKIEEKKVDTKI